MKAKRFLTRDQQHRIVECIREAESGTSGEIRVHLESRCAGDPYARAVDVFNRLGMFRTERRNGVLLYVAVQAHKLAIIGDEGIDRAVPDGFWDETKSLLVRHFSAGDYAGGLCAAILQAGEKLKVYFPIAADDVNEQSDEISFGD